MKRTSQDIEGFLQVIDVGIACAQQIAKDTNEAWITECMELAMKNFKVLQARVVDSTLQGSGGVSGLGISRAIDEWDVPRKLYDAGYDIEEYYRTYWK